MNSRWVSTSRYLCRKTIPRRTTCILLLFDRTASLRYLKEKGNTPNTTWVGLFVSSVTGGSWRYLYRLLDCIYKLGETASSPASLGEPAHAGPPGLHVDRCATILFGPLDSTGPACLGQGCREATKHEDSFRRCENP